MAKLFLGYVLHHIDQTLKFRDPDRYSAWMVEDLMILSRSEHTRIHQAGKNKIVEKAHLSKVLKNEKRSVSCLCIHPHVLEELKRLALVKKTMPTAVVKEFLQKLLKSAPVENTRLLEDLMKRKEDMHLPSAPKLQWYMLQSKR